MVTFLFAKKREVLLSFLEFRSFGVALWEVITFGSLPYSDLTNENVLRLVIKEKSVHLNKPDVQVTHLERMSVLFLIL
jgi:hypothetical protein